MATTLYYPPTQNGLQKSLGAQLDMGTTSSVTLNNTTGIQNTTGVFVVDRIDTGGSEKDASVREYIAFTGVSGSTLPNLTRGLGGTSDQDHAIGAVVEFISDVVQQQAILDFLNNDTTTLTGTQILTNKTLTAPTITTPIIASFYQDAGKTKLMTTPNTASDTLSAIAATQTLTNKRITKRITTITSSATPTINTDNCDCVTITALAVAITSMTTNLSGTPTNFQPLIIRIKDDGTGRAITWGASFEAKGVDLPTTTTASKVLTVGFLYDTVTSKWGCVVSIVES
jgi:hypothetical protein